MLQPRINFGAIYYDGMIFCVGGWKNAFTQYCDSYEIEGNQWEEASSLRIEREGISLCIVGDEWLYAFGEVSTRGKRFKIIKNKWHYTIERMALRGSKNEWELLTVTADVKMEQPSMKNMGCFHHYSNRSLLVIFGGGTSS